MINCYEYFFSSLAILNKKAISHTRDTTNANSHAYRKKYSPPHLMIHNNAAVTGNIIAMETSNFFKVSLKKKPSVWNEWKKFY